MPHPTAYVNEIPYPFGKNFHTNRPELSRFPLRHALAQSAKIMHGSSFSFRKGIQRLLLYRTRITIHPHNQNIAHPPTWCSFRQETKDQAVRVFEAVLSFINKIYSGRV